VQKEASIFGDKLARELQQVADNASDVLRAQQRSGQDSLDHALAQCKRFARECAEDREFVANVKVEYGQSRSAADGESIVGFQHQMQALQDDVAASRLSLRENNTMCKDLMLQFRDQEASYRQEIDRLGGRMADEIGASAREFNQKLIAEQTARSAAVAELRSDMARRCSIQSQSTSSLGNRTSRELSSKRTLDDSIGAHSTWTSRSISTGPGQDRGANRAAANQELRVELEKQLKDISAGRHVPILERLQRTDYGSTPSGSVAEGMSSLDNSPMHSRNRLQAVELRMALGRTREMLKQDLHAAMGGGSETWPSARRNSGTPGADRS